MQGMKREADDVGSQQGGTKKLRVDGRGRDVTLRFLLQSKNAGGIIGKGGQNIKRLRSEYSASVNVPDSNSSERVLSIQAAEDKVVPILNECLQQIGEPPYSGTNKGPGANEFEINFLIHSSQAGSVIGTGGVKIKELRELSGCQIKIYSECLPNATERVVAISGTDEQIARAMESILETMSKTPIKGPVALYEPSSYDSYHDDFSGGYGGPPGRGGMGMRGGGMGSRGGRGGGMRGGRGGRGGGNFGGNFGGGDGGFGRGNRNMGPGGPAATGGPGGSALMSSERQGAGFSQQIPGSMKQLGEGGDNGNYTDFQDPSNNSTQVTIPKDLAGAIIGRGGERIRNIRSRSGADIKIDDPSPDMKDRVITIKGDPEQIQYAQYLMQESVRMYSNK